MIRAAFYSPLVSGNTAPIAALERPDQYSHVIKAVGGYWSATIHHAASTAMMDDWVINGLGRHLRVADETLTTCWEGFVNQVDVTYGNLQVTRGPLLQGQTANRLNATFSTVDVNVIPPTEGVEAETGWADHAQSQARYGIIPKVISVSETNAADATHVRDGLLARNAWPRTSQIWSTGAGAAPGLTITCLGYVHWLFYIYNQLVTAGWINTDAKIIDVLTGTDAATGNPYNLNSAWLPFDTSRIQTPAAVAQVPFYEYEDRTAWELIQGTVSRGDLNHNRWLFGIYDDREAWYYQAPSSVGYTTSLADKAQRVFGPTEVKPWLVRPGFYLRFSDFLANSPPWNTLDEDPRVEFIEDVTYTAPYGLVANGDPGLELNEVMASFGLGGGAGL
jgi:hypothetical protein